MLKSLLKMELQKLLPNRSFIIFMLIYLALLPFIVHNIGTLRFNFSGMKMGLHAIFMFPDIWEWVAYIASFFHFLLGFIIINIITNEFTFGTMRQQIMDGLSRSEVIFSKIIVMFFLASISVGLVKLTSFGYGVYFTEEWTFSDLTSTMPVLINFFIQAIAYMSFAAFIAFLVKRSGLSYILFFVSSLIESIFGRYLPHEVAQYLPLSTMARVVPRPFQEELEGIGMDMPEIGSSLDPALTVVYSLVFLYLAYLSLKRLDL